MINPEKYLELVQSENRSSQGEVSTPVELVDEMLNRVPSEVFESSTTTFLDPSFGSGTFIDAIIKRLRKYGHSMDNIQDRIYGFEISPRLYNKFKTELSINYNFHKLYKEDFLKCDFSNMKFDVIIGNPPYNLRIEDGGPRGTKGDNTYYKKFVKVASTLVKEKGLLLYVTPRGVLSTLDKLKEFKTLYINHMVFTPYWKYSTLYFVTKRTDENIETVHEANKVLDKLYKPGYWKYKVFGMTKGQLAEFVTEDPSRGIPVVAYISGEEKHKKYYTEHISKVVKGPKFACSVLESTPSYTVTDLPMLSANSVYLSTDTLEEAEKLKLFILNSPVLKYLKQAYTLKATHHALKSLPFFDLTKIETGFEYPTEFKLTQQDIKLIESST